MILSIILGVLFLISVGCNVIGEISSKNLLDEKNRLVAQVRNQDQEIRNVQGYYESARSEVVRLTNKMIETENKSQLIEKDFTQRMEDFKKHPTIACMTDGQVTILAEMLAIHIREIMDAKKEYVN